MTGPSPPWDDLPRCRLATLPTPLLAAPRLSEAVGIDVWIKRDDLTGLLLGGNKARKLEFLCGEALAQGCDTLVTGGGPGSNHVQLTAAAAARLGLSCIAVCYGTAPPEAALPAGSPEAGLPAGSPEAGLPAGSPEAGLPAGAPEAGLPAGAPEAALPGGPPEAGSEPIGLRLTRRLGAEVVFTGSPERASVDAGLEEVAAKLVADGRHPYVIPRGGASAVGAVGYALAAHELAGQLAAAGLPAATVLLATGSCGTQAGLVAGAALAGGAAGARLRIVGVPVSRPPEECVERVASLATGCAGRLGSDRMFTAGDVHLLGGYLGPGYGKPSPEGEAAALLAARTEGLLLDPVFTAKAMAALVAETRAGRLTGPVVFLHTGGTPAALAALS